MRRSSKKILLTSFCLALIAGGCTLITEVDRSKIPGEVPGTGGSPSEGGAGGMGGETSEGGMGGMGGSSK